MSNGDKSALAILKDLAIARNKILYPLVPEHARPEPKYSDKAANSLTRCIIDFLNMSGHQAERISNTGRYLDHSKKVTDVLGRTRTIGSGKYIPGTGTNGAADASAIIDGMSVKIEIKIGRDKQSKAQKDYQKSVEDAGGVYFIAKNFEEFHQFYQKLIKEPPEKERRPGASRKSWGEW